MKKPFNYYAVRVHNTVVFRRTIKTLRKVQSVLYKPYSEFRLLQTTYVGGKVIASMSYLQWALHGGVAIPLNGCIKITREQYMAMEPYMQKGD